MSLGKVGCIDWKVLEALSLTLFGTMSPPSPFPFPRHSRGSAPNPPRGVWTQTPSLEKVGGQDFIHGALAGRAVPILSLVCSPGRRLRQVLIWTALSFLLPPLDTFPLSSLQFLIPPSSQLLISSTVATSRAPAITHPDVWLSFPHLRSGRKAQISKLQNFSENRLVGCL